MFICVSSFNTTHCKNHWLPPTISILSGSSIRPACGRGSPPHGRSGFSNTPPRPRVAPTPDDACDEKCPSGKDKSDSNCPCQKDKSIRVRVHETPPDGQPEDFDIQGQGPVLNVIEVVAHTLLHLLHRVRLPSPAVDLGPARDAGFDLEAPHVSRQELAEALVVCRGVRPRPDEAHGAGQHIEELRQFVQGKPAQEPSHAGDTIVITAGLPELVTVLGHGHGPEFPDLDLLAAQAMAPLPKQHGAGRTEPHGQGNAEHERRGQDQGQGSQDEILGTLDALLASRHGCRGQGDDGSAGNLEGVQVHELEGEDIRDDVQVGRAVQELIQNLAGAHLGAQGQGQKDQGRVLFIHKVCGLIAVPQDRHILAARADPGRIIIKGGDGQDAELRIGPHGPDPLRGQMPGPDEHGLALIAALAAVVGQKIADGPARGHEQKRAKHGPHADLQAGIGGRLLDGPGYDDQGQKRQHPGPEHAPGLDDERTQTQVRVGPGEFSGKGIDDGAKQRGDGQMRPVAHGINEASQEHGRGDGQDFRNARGGGNFGV